MKAFNVLFHLAKLRTSIEVVWRPPSLSRIKVNMDGESKGIPSLCACEAIFRNDKSVGSFTHFIKEGNALIVCFKGGGHGYEGCYYKNWDKSWIERDSLMVFKFLSNPNIVSVTIKSYWINYLHKMQGLTFMITHIFSETTCIQTVL